MVQQWLNEFNVFGQYKNKQIKNNKNIIYVRFSKWFTVINQNYITLVGNINFKKIGKE